MSAERTILISEPEAWTIDDLIRHTTTEEGRNVGQALLLKVFAVLREFETRRPNTPGELPIALTEDECWVVDYHVRRAYVDPMGYPVGRGLLLKVFGALLALRNHDVVERMGLLDANDREDDPSARQRLDEYRRLHDRDEPEGG